MSCITGGTCFCFDFPVSKITQSFLFGGRRALNSKNSNKFSVAVGASIWNSYELQRLKNFLIFI